MNERILELEQIRAILSRGDLDDLKGVTETARFEAKNQPYFANKQATDEERLRLETEFAKDITALANHSGGILLLGARTTKSLGGKLEVIESVKGFPSDRFDEARYRTIAETCIMPPLRAIEVQTRAVANRGGHVVAWFDVQRASDEHRPYIVCRADRSGLVKGNYVGVFERTEDQVSHFEPERLYVLLQQGLRSTPLHEKLDRIQEMLEDRASLHPSGPGSKSESGGSDVSLRLDIAVSETKLSGKPVILCWSEAGSRARLPGLFRSPSDPVLKVIANPPSRRAGEFGLPRAMFSGPEAVDGRRQQIVSPGRKGLFVWDDGLVVFAAAADAGFLCWGYVGSFDINPLVLIEAVVLYLMFVNELYELLDPKPNRVTHGLRLERARSGAELLKLYSGPLADGPVHVDLRPAPADGFIQTTSSFGGEAPEVVAYRLIKPLYNWFGFYDTDIPYSQGSRFSLP